MVVSIERIYEQQQGSGLRILVDRLWPRGVTKEKANLHAWFRDVAPSTVLRKKFGHVPGNFREFSVEYRKELLVNPEFSKLLEICRMNDVILLYAASDPEKNNAAVLLEVIREEMGRD